MTDTSSGNTQAHGARHRRLFGLSSLRLRLLFLVLVAAIPAVVLILFTGRQEGRRAGAEAQ
ncbi:MAG: hypothetical protein HY728_10410, partial [Candidatus Rokubacteria bacterium]|nr:hypothetical protein [Candidatus Rokubacteria bacterium]